MTVRYIDKDVLTTPKDGTQVITNAWWWQAPDGRILDYVLGERGIPQYNKQKEVMEAVSGRSIYEGHTPILLEVAFYPLEM